MGRESFGRAGPLATVFFAGLTGVITQVLILRELLVLFHGNELSTGLFYSSWLVGTAVGAGAAGFWHRAKEPAKAVFPVVLLFGCLVIPASLLIIRGSRILWALPIGEAISLPLMVVICLVAAFPPCAILGSLFSMAWSCYVDQMSEATGESPIRVYVFEGFGAAAGGAVFYSVLLPYLPPFHAALAIAALLAGLAIVHGISVRLGGGGSAVLGVTGCVSALLLLTSVWTMNDLEAASRRWQWGDRFVTVRDTPYHNLALLEEAGLFSLFGNGLWYFSAPDPLVAESAVHPVLLQHPRPKTALLIGGGISGLLTEALKHPDMATVDYVEPDPQLIALAREHLPTDLVSVLTDPRARVIHQDAVSFVQAAGRPYDVILLNVGEPMNLEQNRFYTVEFFHAIKRHLRSDGIFSFAIATPPDMVGLTQGRLLRSLNTTLRAVFPKVLLVMGSEGARFLATVDEHGLKSEPQELILRARTRGLSLSYLNEAALRDLFSPFRAQYLDAFLQQGVSPPPNEDFRPVCALQSLLVWSAQIHPALQPILLSMTSKGGGWLWGVVSSLMVFMVVSACVARRRGSRSPGVGMSVLLMGSAQMILQLSLVFAFQILKGFVYTELALIVSAYMVGIASGAGLCEPMGGWIRKPRKWLALAQLVFIGHFAVSVLLLVLFHSDRPHEGQTPLMVVIPVLALIAGALGGLHFSLAVRALTRKESGAPRAWLGGGLYALDLLGAAAGALAASLILLPVYGLVMTCLVPIALLVGSLAALVLI